MAQAYVQDERGSAPTPPVTHAPVEATMTAGSPQALQYAFALANQNTGILRVVGNSGSAYPYLTTTNANASFTELVTFSGGFGQTAFLDYSFEGSLGLQAPLSAPAAAFAQLQIVALTPLSSVNRFETLTGYVGNCGTGTNCEVGTSTARTGSLAFTIAQGATNIIADLHAFASFGNSFDFGDTAKFYLRTPEGVTFSGANGFLSAAMPIGSSPVTSVPEPESYALLLAGLGILGAMTRRKPLTN